MSNRSYPADFSRPLREVPVATDEDVQRMLERLRRRCKIGKTSSQKAHQEARPRVELNLDFNDSGGEISGSILDKANHLPDGSKPSPPAVASLNGSGVAQPIAEHGVDKSRLPGADPAAVAILEWERVGPYAMRTLCRTWTCCKVTVCGHTHYELWRRIAGLERPVRALWDFLTFESAKESAQDEMDRCD